MDYIEKNSLRYEVIGIHQRFPHWHIEQNKRRFLGVFL